MLEEALKEHGVEVIINPAQFQIAQGFHRIDPRSDTYRWEVSAKRVGMNASLTLASYTPMTKIIASKGVVVVKDRRSTFFYDVFDATGN